MKIGSIARINFSVVTLCLGAIMFSQVVGVLPDEREYSAENRTKLCESIATSVSYSIGDHDVREAGRQLELFAERNAELISAGIRRDDELIVEIGEHRNLWRDAVRSKSDGIYVVPIANRQAKWGSLELQFEPLYRGGNRFFSDSLMQLLLIVGVLVGVATWLHLKHILTYLDPNQSVPPRVREVLNSFAEGVVVLDESERIMLVNSTFVDHVGKSREQLLGTDIWDLPWILPDSLESSDGTRKAREMHGIQIRLADDNGQIKTIFSVNSSPVRDDDGNCKGAMMAFNDITPLERSRAALLSTLQDLSQSKKAISEQNEELRFLATRDPLTSCMNRRTFFDQFEQHWGTADGQSMPLCGVMIDIDFFKSINDDYGHGMGDEVLRQTGALLNEMTRSEDVVCRYGGEEFAILMPGLTITRAEQAAESIRIRLSELEFPNFAITASLGVSAFGLGADSPQDMLDQADKCLYVAKRNGRNQVVRFDTVPSGLLVDESKISRSKPSLLDAESSASIPFAAVSALLSALSFRDHHTGMHSTRVSAYAAMLAQQVMSPREAFIVEMGAMLHDIGKVGVPDAVLLKPGPLNDEEWKLIRKHDRIGVEIIKRSFKHPGLTEVVKYHHLRFAGPGSEDQQIHGAEIPIGARILTIVDSFDAMTSDRPYRKGMAIEDAIAELRSCAGTQFDPDLVEKFVLSLELGCEASADGRVERYNNAVVLSIGERVEQLLEAAGAGDGETFLALAERLRSMALQNNAEGIATAATNAINAVSEDTQLECLVEESFELLFACRAMRCNLPGVVEV